jgi:hypothetical protein
MGLLKTQHMAGFLKFYIATTVHDKYPNIGRSTCINRKHAITDDIHVTTAIGCRMLFGTTAYSRTSSMLAIQIGRCMLYLLSYLLLPRPHKILGSNRIKQITSTPLTIDPFNNICFRVTFYQRHQIERKIISFTPGRARVYP